MQPATKRKKRTERTGIKQKEMPPKAAEMKVVKFDEEAGGKEAWLNARLGKITGSRLYDCITLKGTSIKADRWNLVAERLIGSQALVDDEKAIDRGTRLEPEAIARFAKETGKKVDTSLMLWMREDEESIAVSPDGVIGKTAAVEVKCLSAGRHIEAKVTQKIPSGTGYEEQALQYFIVNEKLKVLYFIFYDPRFPAPLDFFYIEMHRKDRQAEIDFWLQAQRDALAWVRDTVNRLTF